MALGMISKPENSMGMLDKPNTENKDAVFGQLSNNSQVQEEPEQISNNGTENEPNNKEAESLPWYNDLMNADEHSSEFSNALAEANKYFGRDHMNKWLTENGLENLIESGEVTPEQLPENSAIQKEAEQLTDSNPHNDEVRNDVVEDAIDDDFFKKFSEGLITKDTENNDDGVDTGYGKAYNDRVELDDKTQKAAEDLGLGELDSEIKHGYYGDYGETMKFVDKLNKYKKEGIKDKFKSPFDGMSFEDVKQAAKSRANAKKFNTTLKDARAEKAYLSGKGSILDTKPSVYWPKERFDEYKTELAKEISTYQNIDNVADKAKTLSELADKAKFVSQVEKELKYANAANGIDVNTYSEKPVEKHIEEDKKPSTGIDWDKVKVYKPGESSPNLVSGYRYDENGNLVDEYGREPKDFERVGAEDTIENNVTETDEDFLGPDEYIDENGNIRVDPNWKPENADEDFVGPDEQLAVISSNLPAEIKNEPVYDTSDYNFDWDYDIQTLGVESPEEIPDAPVENVEQAKAKQRLMNWLKSHGRIYRMSEPDNDMSSREEIHNNYRNGGRAAGSSLLGNIGRHSGLNYDVPNVQSLNKDDKHGGPTNSTASGSIELPNSEKPTERTMSLSTINSGETMFGKSGMLGRADLNKGGEIKVGQSGIKADFTGHTSKPEELAPKPIGGGSNQIYTDLITQILRKFPNGYADNQITITVNGQNVLVNGKQLGQLSDIELQTLKEVL